MGEGVKINSDSDRVGHNWFEFPYWKDLIKLDHETQYNPTFQSLLFVTIEVGVKSVYNYRGVNKNGHICSATSC